jgi:cell filamentation protein
VGLARWQRGRSEALLPTHGLDLILKKRLKRCVDWSRIGKKDYMNAMVQSAVDARLLKKLLKNELTDEIDSREMYRKGIDHSYYYEEE